MDKADENVEAVDKADENVEAVDKADENVEAVDKAGVIAASVTVVFLFLLVCSAVVTSYVLWRLAKRRQRNKNSFDSRLYMLPSSAYLEPTSPTSPTPHVSTRVCISLECETQQHEGACGFSCDYHNNT